MIFELEIILMIRQTDWNYSVVRFHYSRVLLPFFVTHKLNLEEFSLWMQILDNIISTNLSSRFNYYFMVIHRHGVVDSREIICQLFRLSGGKARRHFRICLPTRTEFPNPARQFHVFSSHGRNFSLSIEFYFMLYRSRAAARKFAIRVTNSDRVLASSFHKIRR